MTELAGVREARRLGDYKRALELLRAPKGADAWGLRAALEAECGMLEKAERSRERLEKVLLADPGSGDGAARALDALGRHEAAYKLYLAAGSRGEQRAAELAAWLGIYARAEKLADGLPDGARAWTLRAAARAGRGRLGAALEAAEKAVALDPDDAQARVWRAELLRKLGRRAAASAELDRARALSRGFGESIGMFFNRMLLAAASGAAITMGDRERLGRLGVKGPILKAGEEKALEPATSRGIERALGAMKGNRSRTATRVVSGRLERYDGTDPRGPGGEYARIQRLCLLGEPERAVKEFGRIERSGLAMPRLFAYRGEVRLWQGLYREAIADFDEALRRDPGLPWPRIGKAGALTLLGDPRAALESLADAARLTSPERLWIRRAEALLRSGDARAAAAELRQITGGRKIVPSAWLIEALADPSRSGERLRQLERGCGGFVEEAKRGLGRTGGGASPLLERCLAMMRGNRSLTGIGTYVAESGEMRALPVDDEAAFARRNSMGETS